MFSIGDTLRCLDATNGAHFLRMGELYVVQESREGDGWLLLRHVNGDAMMRMWEPERFQLIREA